MTDDVEYVKGMLTTLDVPVERVLKGGEVLKEVLVLGWTEEGSNFYMASSKSDIADLVLLLEIAKKELLDMD